MRNLARDMAVGGTGLPVQMAWVVFGGQGSVLWLKCLKPGFRHCFVVLYDGEHWITVDPLLGHIDIMVHQLPGHFDFCAWLTSQGLTVSKPFKPLAKNKIAPVMFCTCVELAKRFLGIHKRCIVTPFQLFCYLEQQGVV